MKTEGNAGAERLEAGGWLLAKVARDCGVSEKTASRWRSGGKVPGGAARERLAKAPYRIPGDAWERSPPAARKPPKAKAAKASAGKVDTAEGLRSQVAAYQAMLTENLSADARLKAQRGLTSALVALSRREGTEISEATIVRHPAHKRVMEAVIGAMCERCRKAVLAELAGRL